MPRPPPAPLAAQPSLSEEGLRQVVGEALAGATRDILDQQAALLEELAGTPQVGCGVVGWVWF